MFASRTVSILGVKYVGKYEIYKNYDCQNFI